MTETNTADKELSDEEKDCIVWLEKHSVVLKTTDPQAESTDLKPLKQIIGEAQVVGLGEATHGNREFFEIKHRFIRFLVTELI